MTLFFYLTARNMLLFFFIGKSEEGLLYMHTVKEMYHLAITIGQRVVSYTLALAVTKYHADQCVVGQPATQIRM